jgi:hypothetical protein
MKLACADEYRNARGNCILPGCLVDYISEYPPHPNQSGEKVTNLSENFFLKNVAQNEKRPLYDMICQINHKGVFHNEKVHLGMPGTHVTGCLL